jgi:hypothetical protein
MAEGGGDGVNRNYTLKEILLFKRALKARGEADQFNMVKEECAELIVAVSHLMRRPKGNRNRVITQVIGEMVDVDLMMGELQQALIEETGEARFGYIYQLARETKGRRIEALLLTSEGRE